MREGIEILAGIDICEDFIQLAYYDSEKEIPESVSRDGREEEYLIPARLAYRKKKADWIIGDSLEDEEAEDIAEIKDFVKNVTGGNKIKVGEKEYEPFELMGIFIKEALKILNSYYYFKEVTCLAVTFKETDRELFNMMEQALKEAGIPKGKYLILSHDEAFLNYTVSQKPELWLNDTALFELDDDGLYFRRLKIDRESEPMTAKIIKREKSDKLTRQLANTNKEEGDNIFYTLSLMALEGNVISTIYAVGRGFIDSWGDGTLKKLSPGRRVFRGQNLYAKGACLAAKNEGKLTGIMLLGEGLITADISVKAVKDGKSREISLVKPALKWYEAESEIDLIVKGEKELSITIKDYITKKEEHRFISFSGINDKGLTRIRLTVKFKDEGTCIIKAADLGFGSFVPTTNRVWELIWEK